jgi:hypothetical protein
MNIVYVLYVLYGLGFVNGIFGYLSIKKFLDLTPAIATVSDLENFKQVVRKNMYLALVQIAVLGAGCLVGMYGLFIGSIDLVTVIILNAIIYIFARFLKKLEVASRSLTVTDQLLENEYKTVGNIWLKNALPNF